MIDLRCGDYRDVLADVIADTNISDTPFSERTHKGALSTDGTEGVDDYGWWTPEQAVDFVRWACAHTRGWVCIFNDDVLGPIMREEMNALGRYAFPLLPILQHQPRTRGDGPAQHGCYLAVSRPRTAPWCEWGSLTGWYEMPRDGSIVRGGKPLEGMLRIVGDYSREGDTVVDCTAGGGTTLKAASLLGRKGIGAEIDPIRCDLALTRLADGAVAARLKRDGRAFTPSMF